MQYVGYTILILVIKILDITHLFCWFCVVLVLVLELARLTYKRLEKYINDKITN